jgi:hypothetical protein
MHWSGPDEPVGGVGVGADAWCIGAYGRVRNVHGTSRTGSASGQESESASSRWTAEASAA